MHCSSISSALLLVTLGSTAAALPQVTRVVTSELTLADQDSAVGSLPRDLFTSGATFPFAPGLFGDAPLEGVTPVAVEFDFESRIVVRATMTNNTAAVVDDGLFVTDATAVAAGVGDSYGPLGFISAASLNNNTRFETFQPGETRTVELLPLNNIVPATLSIRYETGSFLWCLMETACQTPLPPYLCELSVDGIAALTGACTVVSSEAEVEHTNRITAELELEDVTAALRTFCAPAGGSPAPDLRAYGALAAGTDWLTMRVEGAPPGALVALLGADTITTTVAGPAGLCIGGLGLARSVAAADALGVSTHEVSLTGFQPGDLIAFQGLYRTATGVGVSTGRLLVAR